MHQGAKCKPTLAFQTVPMINKMGECYTHHVKSEHHAMSQSSTQAGGWSLSMGVTEAKQVVYPRFFFPKTMVAEGVVCLPGQNARATRRCR